MKLTFRGNVYEPPAPRQIGSNSLDSNSTDQPKIKLLYRGNAFDYIPCSVTVSEQIKTDEPTVTLIYRGNAYKRRLHPK